MSKRSSNGSGCFYKTPKGLWQYTISVGYKADGSRKRKSFYGKTQKIAKDKAAKYLNDKNDGLNVDEKIRFSDYADFWYEHHKTRVSDSLLSARYISAMIRLRGYEKLYSQVA